jgi:hypothetical protein
MGSAMGEEQRLAVERLVRAFMEDKWEEHLQFFNFAENEAFLVSAAVYGMGS